MAKPWYKRLLIWLGVIEMDKNKEQAPPASMGKGNFTDPYAMGQSRLKGKFLFPVIPDEERKSSTHANSTTNSTQSNINRESSQTVKPIVKEWQEMKKEKGYLKKADDVPSPVFGFQRPSQKSEPDLKTEIMDKLNHSKEKWLQQEAVILNPVQNEDVIIEELPEINIEETPVVDSEDIPVIVTEDQSSSEIRNPLDHHDVAQQSSIVGEDEGVKTKIPFNVFNFKSNSSVPHGTYQYPKLTLLNPSPPITQEDKAHQKEMVENLEHALESFNVQAKVIGILRGPTVTRIEVQPAPGVKVNRITNLADDIKLNLAVKDIRIEAPIPGKSAVGIEVPNRIREPVNIIDIIGSSMFKESKSPLTVALGKDIEGKPVVMDLCKMPHGLIAGSTGSGKSVCINSIIISLLYKASPEEVKMILIDPKMVELAPYHDLPHLATPVVTDPKQATMALKWAVEEMDRRYEIFAQNGVRDLERYNEMMATTRPEIIRPALPYILIVIDELADLMMVAPGDVEEYVARIAQKARACGIHLLLATQRPSVDVITGMIKANIPTRIAFSVSSQVDSRTILDTVGAERLLGRGDMLLSENGSNKAIRLQGNYVSDEEIEKVCEVVRAQRKPEYIFDKESLITAVIGESEDDLFEEAVLFVIEQEMASTSSLQRKFRIGYNRAARLIDLMEQKGLISEALGSKPRNVLMTRLEYEEWVGKVDLTN